MGTVIDLTGKVFGRWKVKGLSHQKGKALFWQCRCECGVERPVFGGDLKRGGSLSCGCLMRERAGNRSRSHGLSTHPAYRSWIEMKARCERPEKEGFHLYGGRGIKVCDRWSTFEGFWQDMGASWQKGLSLDRVETNGNYEPGNCRWATPQTQANNRRTNIIIQTPKGKMTVTDAARAFGLNPTTVNSRIRYGWPENQLLLPKQRRSHAK